MLLGGKGGCQNCGCVPCNDCAQTCVNPHTGTAFETVYHYYVLGVEEGNVTDGYLTASGDVDTSDPYDGMDGTGPWYQEISGGFNFYPGATRFPCVMRFSFWRNNFPLGPTTVPPPSGTLTANAITVTCQSGAVRVGDHIVNAGETYTTGATVPLVSGAGDQSGADPRSYDGTVSVSPVCDTAGFSIKARIDWNTKKRQHILYGTVRECYEEGTPCATVCSGNPPPSVLYLTLSNIAITSGTFGGTLPNGTYAMDRIPGYCSSYLNWLPECVGTPLFTSYAAVNSSYATGGGGVSMVYQIAGGSECGGFLFTKSDTALAAPCGTGTIASGSGTWQWQPQSTPGTAAASGTLDWSVTS